VVNGPDPDRGLYPGVEAPKVFPSEGQGSTLPLEHPLKEDLFFWLKKGAEGNF
jgi:hypothetical protein